MIKTYFLIVRGISYQTTCWDNLTGNFRFDVNYHQVQTHVRQTEFCVDLTNTFFFFLFFYIALVGVSTEYPYCLNSCFIQIILNVLGRSKTVYESNSKAISIGGRI